MNDEIPTLFMDTTPDGSTMLVLLVDPYTRTYWHGYMSRSTFYVQKKNSGRELLGLERFTLSRRLTPSIPWPLRLICSAWTLPRGAALMNTPAISSAAVSR